MIDSNLLPATEKAKIERCLAVAFRKDSPNEIASGITAANRILSKYKMTLVDYWSHMTGATPPVSDQLLQATAVDQERRRFEREIASLRDQVSGLERENRMLLKSNSGKPTQTHAPVGGFFSYNDFHNALIAHLGTSKRALSTYAEHTGVSMGKIQAWRRSNKVPADLYDRIEELKRETQSFHQQLTGEHKRRIDVLTIDGMGDNEIVQTMNSEYADRHFNLNMIKGAKNQIRTQYVKDLKFDGVSREEAMKAFAKRYPKTRVADRLFDSVYKD